MADINYVLPPPNFQYIEQGRYFFFEQILKDIDSANPLSMLILTPAKPPTIYMQCAMTTANEIDFGMYEEPGIAFEGVGVALRNARRDSAHEPAVRLHVAPSITEEGVSLREHHFTGTTGLEKLVLDAPIILSPDTAYLLQWASTANTNSVNFYVAFVEK